MSHCNWSQNNLCQVLVLKNTHTFVTCDGRHAACAASKGLILEDIRHRHPQDCPHPLCILDMSDPSACQSCPYLPRKPKPGWGGKRPGAGAPRYNLNRLKHGQQSKLLRKGIERMAEDPMMRAVLLIIARLAIHGEVPPQTKKVIQVALRKEGVSYESETLGS